MTSTNINIGIEGRSTSRVLKPPGGGHTDIFGKSHETAEVTNSRYTKYTQKTSISECLGFGPAPPTAVKKQEQPTIKESNETSKLAGSENGLKNGNGVPTPILIDEDIKPTVTVAATAPPVAQAQRVRVPPGGFSSGLW